MSATAQPHMVFENDIPMPCGCCLGYHHRPDAEPVIEHDERGDVIVDPGRHPYCVGLCRIWGTPTEEFDFELTTGRLVTQGRISTCYRIVDHVQDLGSFVEPSNDPVEACSVTGVRRMAAWKRAHPTAG